jgi:hypothetical protein
LKGKAALMESKSTTQASQTGADNQDIWIEHGEHLLSIFKNSFIPILLYFITIL